MPHHSTTGKKRITFIESDDYEFEEDSVPLKINQSNVKKKQISAKKSAKRAKLDESSEDLDGDDLDGFIVKDEEDVDMEEKTMKKTSKSRSKAAKSTEEKKPKKPVVKKEAEAKVQTVEKRKVSGAYRPRWLGPERDPPKHGSKPIPVGKPGCLEGIIFVLTGLNESLTRDETTELIQKYGGLIRSAVSGKTKYLVAGFEMEDGRPITEGSKYKAAQAKGATIINEDKLLDMIRASNPEGSAKEEAKQAIAIQQEEKLQAYEEEKIMENHLPVSHSRLLTVKYAPSNSTEIIGNKAVLDNFRLWLEQWEDVIINQSVIVQHNRQNPGARAALLSGPPGIGKTTSAHVLGKECGYEVIEFNASDKRNMLAVRSALKDVVFTKTLQKKKRLIIMDEVDGMSRGDRGGVGELIKIIKTAMVPIVCICNDRDNAKVRSLTSHCYDLSFTKPSSNDVVNRLVYICNKEGIQSTRDELSDLVEATNGDIRQCLNKLQIIHTVNSNASIITFAQDKYLDQTGFEAAKRMLVETGKYSFNDRYNLFFNDYSLTPLVLEQNYLDSIKSKRYKEETMVEVMAEAADSICDLENLQHVLVQNNNWKLLPSAACLTIRSGFKSAGSFVFTKFPAFYGKFSKIRKSKRLMCDLYTHLSAHMSGTISAISQEYFEVLSQYLIDPLLNENPEECIERLDEYSLTKEDLVEGLNYAPLGDDKTLYESVPTKIKSALTRKYAQQIHPSTNIYSKEEDLFSRKQSKKRNSGETKKKEKKTKIEEEEEISSTEDEEGYYVYYSVCLRG